MGDTPVIVTPTVIAPTDTAQGTTAAIDPTQAMMLTMQQMMQQQQTFMQNMMSQLHKQPQPTRTSQRPSAQNEESDSEREDGPVLTDESDEESCRVAMRRNRTNLQKIVPRDDHMFQAHIVRDWDKEKFRTRWDKWVQKLGTECEMTPGRQTELEQRTTELHRTFRLLPLQTSSQAKYAVLTMMQTAIAELVRMRVRFVCHGTQLTDAMPKYDDHIVAAEKKAKKYANNFVDYALHANSVIKTHRLPKSRPGNTAHPSGRGRGNSQPHTAARPPAPQQQRAGH
jgi:hypothetical protein